MAVEIVAFEREHLDGAAALLAARHARHRAVEPGLPSFEDMRAQVESELDEPGASGAAALDGDRLVGFVIGRRKDDVVGPATYVQVAGHAVDEPDLVRDLYGVAAERWVDEGSRRHFAFVPAIRELLEPWYRLSFGVSAAQAVQETRRVTAPDTGVVIRPGGPDDLEASARLDLVLSTHLAAPPSFSDLPVPTFEEMLEEWRDTWDDERFTHFMAERDGVVVGHVLLYRRPAGDLRIPPDSIDLANCATFPEARGSGAGLALAAHALTWAHEQGIPWLITDWRMTNLVASRFWPRRGFRETFQRVYRSIP